MQLGSRTTRKSELCLTSWLASAYLLGFSVSPQIAFSLSDRMLTAIISKVLHLTDPDNSLSPPPLSLSPSPFLSLLLKDFWVPCFPFQVVSLPAYYGWHEADAEALSQSCGSGPMVATVLRTLGSSYKGQLEGAVLGKQSNVCNSSNAFSLSAHHGAFPNKCLMNIH